MYNNSNISHEAIEQVTEIHVDALCLDHEDDLDESEEDNDATREAAIRDEAINPNWNIVEDDSMIKSSWQGLNLHVHCYLRMSHQP